MLKIAMIPIDNRPVCYNLPKDINNFCVDTKLFLPPRELLGGLITTAKSEKLLDWLESLNDIDVFVIALDTIAYGGLVPSRRTTETFEQISSKLNRLKQIIQKKQVKTYACSSIMRISNNNINEEEKSYWNIWGKKIFDYSFNLHKAQKTKSYDSNAKFSCIRQIIPTEILDDYFNTRKRNFEINKIYLNWQADGILDYLVFSKDDCAEFGINVAEAEEIQEIINNKRLNAIVKTGADEIPLSLMARAFCDTKSSHPKIYTDFLRPEQTHLVSKYEDISIKESAIGQIELCGAIWTNDKNKADIILIINNFSTEQGELVMGVDTELFSGSLQLPNAPYILADVAFANGADNNFVEEIFSQEIDWEKFLGFAGWNTSANTLGNAICAGLLKYLSPILLNEFKRSQFIRFADDWAYQANCRKKIKTITATPDTNIASELLKPFAKKIEEKFDINLKQIDYVFPWNRFFEIEILPTENPDKN